MSDLPDGWDCPTLRRLYNEDGTEGEIEIITPLRGYDGYTRLLAEIRADGEQCDAEAWNSGGLRGVCSLVLGHVGDHWFSTPELAAEAAPVAVWAELVDDGDCAS